MKKNKRAFTLIEVLAIITILALILILTIPNFLRKNSSSKTKSFKDKVLELVEVYKSKNLEGTHDVCGIQDECKIKGYIEKNSLDEISVYLTNGIKCASGNIDNLEIKNGVCGENDTTSPVINNVEFYNLSTTSVDVIVKIEENESIIKTHQYRLLNKKGEEITGWQDGDYLYDDKNLKVSKKTFKDLIPGTLYYLELKIINTSSNKNNTTTALYRDNKAYQFETFTYTRPVVTYKQEWETEKEVSISFDKNALNSYRILLDSDFTYDEWKTANPFETVKVSNYHNYLEAKTTMGSTILTTTVQVGFIDNESDPDNPKPTSILLDYKNGSGINTNDVSISLFDTLSGVAYYCIATEDKKEKCDGIGNNTDLDKWVLVSDKPEVREKTIQHQFTDSGKYYVFVKDYVGNISDPNEFKIYKVSYDLNGGNADIPYQIKLEKNNLTLREIVPTKEGYIFKGWNLDGKKHNVDYINKGIYNTDKDINLFAIWERKIGVTYNSNSGNGEIKSTFCSKFNNEENCEVKLENNSFTREGYKFIGWASEELGEIAYKAATTQKIADNMTLYAGWLANDLVFNNQEYNKEFNTVNTTFEIKSASNGTGNYEYSKVSEIKGKEKTSYASIDSKTGNITLAASTPMGRYEIEVEAKSKLSNTVDKRTETSKKAKIVINVIPHSLAKEGSLLAKVEDKIFINNTLTPEPEVKNGETVLVKGKDFDYIYSNNRNVGTATIKVKGKGNYTGENSTTFVIKPYDISNVTVDTLPSKMFTGNTYTPVPTIKINELNTTLANNKDFKLVYENNKNIGTASVIITGIGNYSGTKTVNFNIGKKEIAVVWSGLEKTYNGTVQKPTAKADTGIKGSTVTLNVSANGINAGTHEASVSCSNCENYVLKNSTTTYKINPINIKDAKVSGVKSLEYTGIGQTQDIEVTLNNVKLVNGTDIEYSYSNNKEVGNATITITGRGNYTGSKTINFAITKKIVDVVWNGLEKTYNGTVQVPSATAQTSTSDILELEVSGGKVNAGTYEATATCKNCKNYNIRNTKTKFKINPLDINSANVSEIPSKSYTGANITPVPEVSILGKNLVNGKDFKLSYSNNKNIGTATITITGIGNYTGSKIVNFMIGKKEISIVWSGLDKTYNGKVQIPSATVSTGIKGSTITLNVQGIGVNAGTYEASASCTNCENYVLKNTTTSYKINPLNIKDAKISGVTSLQYNGLEQTQEPAVTLNNVKLVKGTDIEYSYSNNKEVGIATITITGRGNYTGTKTVNFTITKRNVSVVWDGLEKAYNGLTQVPTASAPTSTSDVLELEVSGGKVNVGTYDVFVTCKNCKNYVLTNTKTKFKINPLTINNSTTSDVGSKVYTGSNITPVTEISISGKNLVNGKDFKLSYSNNKNVGTAIITITGIGNYTGSKTINFAITKKEISIVWSGLDKTYNGKVQVPSATVSTGIKGSTVTLNVQGNGVNAGTYEASASCTNCDNYSLMNTTTSYKINPLNIKDAKIGSVSSYIYNGLEQRPEPTVTLNNVKLVKDKDIMYNYSNNVEVGTATITITGIGNYSGTKTVNFNIIKKTN